jgi:hypothetical protein
MSDTHHRHIRELVKSARPRSELVAHFEAYGRGYYALLKTGERLDFVRVESFQPPIEDFNDYFSYMFVQAHSGFYVLRQRIIENKIQPWEMHMEIEAYEPAHFFRHMCGRAGDLLELPHTLDLAESGGETGNE